MMLQRDDRCYQRRNIVEGEIALLCFILGHWGDTMNHLKPCNKNHIRSFHVLCWVILIPLFFSGTLLLGPRLGRYTKDAAYFQMASPTNVVLGTFFLWWGWIGFNCGSQLAISGSKFTQGVFIPCQIQIAIKTEVLIHFANPSEMTLRKACIAKIKGFFVDILRP